MPHLGQSAKGHRDGEKVLAEAGVYFDLRSKVLSLEKTQNYFGFLLAYSYLCSEFGVLRPDLK